MKVTLPKLVKYSTMDCGNKTRQRNALKIYAALYKKARRKNKEGFFPVPSSYLEAINKRYKIIIDKFIEDGIIEFYSRPSIDPENIFNTIEKKYYNKSLGICMKYRFLIDISKGEEVEIDMKSNRQYNWYKITENSLIQLGYKEINILRDDFGRRLHHNLTQCYKEELSGKGYIVIDAKCSQPRLLYLMMKERGIVDDKYNYIFDNNIDFYSYIVDELELENRTDAKELFMYWLNSDGYVPNYNIHRLFPDVSRLLKTLKNKYYKDSSSFMQREEAKIWIDDILENLPFSFGLTIHDSLIIKDKDALKALKYCRDKYPQIQFEFTEL